MTVIANNRLTPAEFQGVVRHLDVLVQQFEALPFPEVQAKVFDLLQTVDALHRAGLSGLVGILNEGGTFERASEDPVVRTLLELYDLIPDTPLAQADAALEVVRPYIRSHGGDVEILDVVEGVVHLRLSGSCQGCAGSTITLKRGIETALRDGLPGFQAIQVHEPPLASGSPASGFIPLNQIGATRGPSLRRPVFKPVARLGEISPGTMKASDVGGIPVLLANVAGEIYAVRDACPDTKESLSSGSFAPPVVVCPWHNEAFDVRTGKRVDGAAGPGLDVLPIALQDGVIKLAVNTVPEPVGSVGVSE